MSGDLIYKCKRCDKYKRYFTKNITRALSHIYGTESNDSYYDSKLGGSIPDSTIIIHDCLTDTYYGVAEFIGYDIISDIKEKN